MLLVACLSRTISAIGVSTIHILQEEGAVKRAPPSPSITTGRRLDGGTVRPRPCLLSSPVQPHTSISLPTIGHLCTTPASIPCQDMSDHAGLDKVGCG
jgi:hypothetical protein